MSALLGARDSEKEGMDSRNSKDREASGHLLSPTANSYDSGSRTVSTRPSQDLESSDLENFDDDELIAPGYWKEPPSFIKRQKDRIARWRILQCPSLSTLNRRQRMLAVVVAIAVAFVLALLIAGHKTNLIRHRPENSAPPPPPPKDKPKKPERPQYCTTWPVDKKGHVPVPDHANPLQLDSFAPKGGWKKPRDVKIIGMVFYGRRRFIDVLDCYLQQNLASNGGYLDEVWFMVHTSNEDDVEWLSDFVQKTEKYRFFDLGEECTTGPYGCIWDFATADDTMYIKIDDDITYVHPDTIPRLVHTRIDQPHPFAISANLVNSPMTGYIHFHVGAIHPFLPDSNSKPKFKAAETWRPSRIPLYPGDPPPLSQVDAPRPPKTKDGKEPPKPPDVLDLRPPYQGHRWQMLSNNSIDLLRTPMGSWDSRGVMNFGVAWKSWAIATQEHYSLMKNLEDNQMAKYHFGSSLGYSGDDVRLWDMQFSRYNLNFIAVWGSDIRANLPIGGDDEEEIGVTIPRRTGRPFVIDTKAVVAHLNFGPQTDGVEQTDLLDRWRAFANENICKADNRKEPFDNRCKGF
ncbi:hypothetical protein K402DRAFT_462049 [Aulographum hederae CBS 113979]|uniref:Uncharacterized protein n=1 Tax=Aulographum hederae CBS 113979 TaxID=1176131 RepID=A0A6G1H4Z1_9PEZI|nr:hypothetical protein K402DRAFT_462049 [Aulographum hederae CBS 113979]